MFLGYEVNDKADISMKLQYRAGGSREPQLEFARVIENWVGL
jgi:hypothetical protein